MSALLAHLDATSDKVRLHLAGDSFVAGEVVRGLLVVPVAPVAPPPPVANPDPEHAVPSDAVDQSGTRPHPHPHVSDDTAADSTAELGAIKFAAQPASMTAGTLHFVGVQDLPNGEQSIIAHAEQSLTLPTNPAQSSSREAYIPFHLTLPQFIHGAYKGQNATVRYAILVEVDFSGQTERSTKTVQVLPKLEDLLSQAALLKRFAPTKKTEQAIDLTVTPSSHAVLAGNLYTLPIAVSNHSSSTIKRLRVVLAQIELVLPPPLADASASDVQAPAAPLAKEEQEVASALLSSDGGSDLFWPGVPTGVSLDWTATLEIPHTTATILTVGGSGRVQVSYQVVVEVLPEDGEEAIVRNRFPVVLVAPKTVGAALGLVGQRPSVHAPGFLFSAPQDHPDQAADSSASLSNGGLVPPSPFRGRGSGLNSNAPGSSIPRSSSPPATPRGTRKSLAAAPRLSPGPVHVPGNDSADSTTVDLGNVSDERAGDLSGISEHTEATDTDTSAQTGNSTVGDDSSEDDHHSVRHAWPGASGTLDLGAPPTVPAVRGQTARGPIARSPAAQQPSRIARPSPTTNVHAKTTTPGARSTPGSTPGGLAARRRQVSTTDSPPATRTNGPSSTPSSGLSSAGLRPPNAEGLRRSPSGQNLSGMASRSSDASRSPGATGPQRSPASLHSGRPAGRVVSGGSSAGLKRSMSTQGFPAPSTPTPGMRRSGSSATLASVGAGASAGADPSPSSVPVRRPGAAAARARPQSLFVGSKEQVPPSLPPMPRARVDSTTARSRVDSNTGPRMRRLASGSSLSSAATGGPHSLGTSRPPAVRPMQRPATRQASAGSVASGGAVKAKVSMDQIIGAPPAPPMGGRKAMTELGFAFPAGRARAGSGVGASGMGASHDTGPTGFTFKNYAAGGAQVRLGPSASPAGAPASTSPGLPRSQSHAQIAGSGVGAAPRARVAASEIGASPPVRAKVTASANMLPSHGQAHGGARSRVGSTSSYSAVARNATQRHTPSRTASRSHMLAPPSSGSPARVRTKSGEF